MLEGEIPLAADLQGSGWAPLHSPASMEGGIPWQHSHQISKIQARAPHHAPFMLEAAFSPAGGKILSASLCPSPPLTWRAEFPRIIQSCKVQARAPLNAPFMLGGREFL